MPVRHAARADSGWCSAVPQLRRGRDRCKRIVIVAGIGLGMGVQVGGLHQSGAGSSCPDIGSAPLMSSVWILERSRATPSMRQAVQGVGGLRADPRRDGVAATGKGRADDAAIATRGAKAHRLSPPAPSTATPSRASSQGGGQARQAAADDDGVGVTRAGQDGAGGRGRSGCGHRRSADRPCQASSSIQTGTWSDGFSRPRTCLSIPASSSRSAACGRQQVMVDADAVVLFPRTALEIPIAVLAGALVAGAERFGQAKVRRCAERRRGFRGRNSASVSQFFGLAASSGCGMML